MNYELMDIEDFNAIKFANDIKKSRGLQACTLWTWLNLSFLRSLKGSWNLKKVDHRLEVKNN